MTIGPSRRGLVPPFIAMDVMRAATEFEAAGADVIHLEVGQPGTPAPQAVLEAARQALDNARIGYTDALGIAPLREAIARHYGAQYGLSVDPSEVVVTTGSSAAFQLAFLAAFEAGDRVALAVPGYPAYRNILAALGIEPVLLEVGENSALSADPGIARRGRRARRVDHRQPGQPDRHDDRRRRAGAARRILPRARHSPGLGRDLSRHHL